MIEPSLSGEGIPGSDAAQRRDIQFAVLCRGEVIHRCQAIGRTMLIGRQSGCELRLNDAIVSRQHARLRLGHDLHIEDLGSRNGTRVNGSQVTHAQLHHGDVIDIGPFQIKVRAVEQPSAEATVPLRRENETALLRPHEAVSSGLPPARIVVIDGPRSGEVFDLRRPFVALGELGEEVAVVTRGRDRYRVRGLTGLGERLMLNDEPLDEEPRSLGDGDRLRIGTAEMVFRTHGDE